MHGTSQYYGALLQGKPIGRGTFTRLDNGDTYSGYFWNGYLEGIAVMTLKTHDTTHIAEVKKGSVRGKKTEYSNK